MRRKLLAALALLLLLTGCSSDAAQSSLSGYVPDESERLVIYTSHKTDVYWPIVNEFEQRTGIWVEVVSGGTNEILERISKESGSPMADVMFGGGVESLEAYRDCFTPYTCAYADEIQAQFRAPDDLWTPFSALPVVLIYNTKLVEPNQVTGWDDLLSPELRGRIAFADPGISGSCFTGLVTMLYALGGSLEDTVRSFSYNLDGRQFDSSGTVLSSVAGGTDLVGVTLEETALQHIAAGDNIAMVYPSDGTSCVPDGSALVKGAPHEDNAKLFLDFTASQEVQQLLVSQFYRRSVRGDVAPMLQLAALEDIPMVDYDIDWASGNRDSILMTWAFYLGGGAAP